MPESWTDFFAGIRVSTIPPQVGRRSGILQSMAERRPSNSELKLLKIEQEEAERADQPGILELFDRAEQERAEDAPLARDDADE